MTSSRRINSSTAPLAAIRRRMTLRDEEGMTTVGMAIALLVSLSLVFSGAQLYKTTSAAAEIQEVADACALAAENEVSEYVIVANACDAAILSMSLLAITTYGASILCACVPPLAEMSAALAEIGGKVIKARNDFSSRAKDGLNALQRLLPFLSAASAASVARANDQGAMDANYMGIAILVPQEGEKLDSMEIESLDSAGTKADSSLDGIRDSAARAEEAAKEAQKAKERAFMADCGNDPGRCMSERASAFGYISEYRNPRYANVDAWSFQISYERAKAYYAERLSREGMPSGSAKDKASYHLRMRFYSYCLDLLESEGHIQESEDSFAGYLPKLPSKMDEVRATELFSEPIYPISGGGASKTVHAYDGCPALGSVLGRTSIDALEHGSYATCSQCDFTAQSMGKIASATTNVDTGFEYHYEIVRTALDQYSQARSLMDPAIRETKNGVNGVFDALKEALSDVVSCRIDIAPPGRNGAIALVVNTAQNDASSGFESLFVRGGATLGTRAAVSAAALVEDSEDECSSIITEAVGRFAEDGGALTGAFRIVADIWSGLLHAYEDGQSAIDSALTSGLTSVHSNTASGLGQWCSDALKGLIKGAGLEPADLKAKKPVVLSTGHVAGSSDGAFEVNFRKIKTSALATSSPATDFLSWLEDGATSVAEDALSQEFTIAEIMLPIDESPISIKLALPQAAVDGGVGVVSGAFEAIRSANPSAFGGRTWR